MSGYSRGMSLPPEEKAGGGDIGSEPMWKVPANLTPLIGREREVTALCTLLNRPTVRLLTLLGTGGVGKTRLSLQVAAEMQSYFPDGICFVYLAAVSDSDLVVPTIAQELGIQEVGLQSLFDQVKVALRAKRFLLILDNFEQVMAAAHQIKDLLEACFELKILVTSRVVLHVQGEQEFPVSPLSLPDLAQVTGGAIPSPSEAVTLFVQRAQAVLPDFQITRANARAIAEICVRLDGLPLAIELAAARIKLLPPQALLARLSQRLHVLTGGAGSFTERHQTLRGTLKWSFDLLDAQEQQHFRRLAVFVGGWTLEAVAAIWTTENESNSASFSELDALASLLDKSLVVQVAQEGAGEPRYMMLETVREYAQECLHESGEVDAIQRVHALYFLSLVEQAEPYLREAQQTLWLARLEREQENLRTALARLIEHEEAELALRLCGGLWWFWHLRGYWSEGRGWLSAALAIAHPEGETAARAKALCVAGHLAYSQDDYAIARPMLEKAIALSRTLNVERILASALGILGVLLHMQGEPAEGQRLLTESEALCRAAGYTWQLTYLLRQSGFVALYQGDLTRAAMYTQESLKLARELGDKFLIAITLSLMGGIAMRQGDVGRARSLSQEALALAHELGDKALTANALQNCGYIESIQGNLAQASALAHEGLLLARELGDRTYISVALHTLGHLLARQNDLAWAAACYREGLSLAQEIENEMQIGWNLVGLALLAAAEGQPVRAARLSGAAEARFDINVNMNSVERSEYEQVLQDVRARLGEKAFAAAQAEGHMLTPQQILDALEPASSPQKPDAKTSPAYPAGLTEREVEILRLVAQGLSAQQIADQLIISYRTVTTHLTSIYGKLGVTSRSGATRFAVEHQLV